MSNEKPSGDQTRYRSNVPWLTKRLSLHSGLAVVSLLLTSCTVGPDFKPPPTATPAAWVGADQATPAPSNPTSATPTDLAIWWRQFNDPRLDSLIDRAIAANYDLRIAEARLRQARAARTVAAAPLWPQVNASAAGVRSRTRAGTGNVFRAGFDASWEIDIFGGTRRAVEAAEADIDAAQWDLRSVLTSVIAEIATTYYDLQGTQRQIAVARENLAAQEQTTLITEQRFQGGFVSGLDYANARAQVASTRSLIPTLEATAQQQRYAIAILLGREPGALLDDLAAETPNPPTPPEVPVGLPSDLLLRRPDIRRAEAGLHAATARVGVAVADLFPRFSITGALGLQGSKISALSTAADRFWSIGPAVTVPIFEAGRIQGNIAEQEAIRDATFDQYRQTVLTSLQEVENALVAYTSEQESNASLVEAVEQNRRAVDIATQRYTAGSTGFIDVLNAQRSLFTSEEALARSDTARVTSLVALYKALGGGWDDQVAADDPKAP